MKTLGVALFSLVALAACTKETDARTVDPRATTRPDGRAPDDTGVNKRDRNGTNLTPMDQSNDKAHIDLTASVRRALTEDDNLSSNAKNVKVITTKDGVVTLRGPVKDQAERATVVAKARAAAGTANVVDQLDVENR